MRFSLKIVFFTVAFSTSLIFQVNADTVYLKNGHSLEGFVVNEDEKSLDLEVGFGTLKIEKNLIRKVSQSGPQESAAIQQRWQKEKLEAKEQQAKVQPKQETGLKDTPSPVAQKQSLPQEIEVNRKGRHLFVDAILNNEIRVSLMIDTGASLVVLSKEVGEELGFDTYVEDPDDKAGMVSMTMADGTKTQAKFVRLDSVNVEGVKLENVAAAVLLDDQIEPGFKDGLLGMSFLSKFNFQFDVDNNRLILE